MIHDEDEERNVVTKLSTTVANILLKMTENTRVVASRQYSHTAPQYSQTVGRKSYNRSNNCWAYPGCRNNRLPHQCFHLQVPEANIDIFKQTLQHKQPLQYSLSAPYRSTTGTGYEAGRRPLPGIPNTVTPHTGRGKQISKSHSFKHEQSRSKPQEDRISWVKHLVRRKTIAVFSKEKNKFDEEHIYEEIDKDCDEIDAENNSFLSLISSERRKNLQFYGCTGWDFGPDM